jgi:hypothetical protein
MDVGNMEASGKRYILESFRDKYHRAGKAGKGAILEELGELLTCHRKHAVRLVKKRAPGRKPGPQKRGRKSKYDDPGFLRALHMVRRVMEFRNAEVMKENMEEWLPFIEKHKGVFDKEIRSKLLSISSGTMKRIFRRAREKGGTGLSTTRPGSILRMEIPIRTDSFWVEKIPGKMAMDTVGHCGNSTEGQYVYSLDAVCPVTHWTAQRATWGKGHSGILEASKSIEQKLPFELLGWHVDNGTEFINHAFVRHYLHDTNRLGFSMTRSRANKKNDNCHVEQKNWSVVRRYLGYDRLDFSELVPLINDLYENELYLYLNHFCRTFKLEQKIAIKSRYRRIYGTPQTPYERVLESEHVPAESKARLVEQHKQLDPVLLKIEIERKLRIIFARYKNFTKARHAASAA